MGTAVGGRARARGASRAENITVNAAALVQGIALVTFPAASTIFTARGSYDLSSSQYGLMFVPQVITAVTAALLGAGLVGPGLARRLGERTIYLAGLVADLLAMGLLIVSWLAVHQHGLAYGLLLVATACLGAGFGLAVPALNTLTAAFHPQAVDRSVLVLNALLGLGTALAPVFVAIFVGLGFWTGLPVLAAVLLLALIAVSLRLPLRPAAPSAPLPEPGAASGARVPGAFWLFGAFALLYGVCETMNGNWSQLDMTSLGVKTSTAALGLTAFWAFVTVGRVLFAAVGRWLPSRVAYHVLPFLLAGAFLVIAVLPRNAPLASVAAFGLAGLGCSALLPLTISIGQEKLTGHQTLVAGGVIACYQLGYGIAAFGVGPLLSAGLHLPAVFGISAAVAAAMGLVSLAAAHGRPSPKRIHPRPAPATPRP
ncbi:MAG TPA: MFS transporter [Streptosporangiaceae bacterium]|nr:MFS transporter [Streptosporangiaceae bacterium]